MKLPDRPRFTRLVVSNYRSLGPDVSVELAGLTVLVGINGSGKSNVADAFRFLANALTDGLESAIEDRHGFDSLRRSSPGRRGDLKLRVELAHPDWEGEYEFVLGGSRDEYKVKREHAVIRRADRGVERFETRDGVVIDAPEGLDRPAHDSLNLTFPKLGGDDRLRPLFDALRACEVYSIFPDRLREPQKPSPRPSVTKQGDNWASVVRNVARGERGGDLRSALSRVTGDVVDVRVRRGSGGYLVVEFGHRLADGEPLRWFDSALESDGTLRIAGIVTALLQTPPLTLLGVEEPELTIHAGMLPLLYDYLAQAVLSSQVLITTHNPDLLDLIDIESVRVVERRFGVSTVSRVDEGQRGLVRDRLTTPGGLLRSEGLIAEPTSSAS